MTIFNVEHTTVYRYAQPVAFGEHKLMFRPRDSHDLRLLDTSISLSPPATIRWYHDVFGNSIALATFSDAEAELRIVSTIKVEHYASSSPLFELETYARTFPFSYPTDAWPDLGRTVERHYPDPEHLVDAWAHDFLSKNGETNTMGLLVSMTQAIQQRFGYERRYAEGTQTPVETLTLGVGSCRDFALLMMEAARSLGLAARFVMGYLHDPGSENAPSTTVGGRETHAWAQIFLPGAGWVEFDPTNGLVGGNNLIRVAVTRDPIQAVAVSGMFTGPPDVFLDMSVEVIVTAG